MSLAEQNNKIVSSPNEALILVDSDDNEIGSMNKYEAHEGCGVLHRAFSILLFNHKNEILLQKRHKSKHLWGGYWSNACCSHPRQGESMEYATSRRLNDELGLNKKIDLHYVYKFEYHAIFENIGSEHELCHVYLGRIEEEPKINETEISDWRFVSVEDLDQELQDFPDRFTPWFKQEWQEVKANYLDKI